MDNNDENHKTIFELGKKSYTKKVSPSFNQSIKSQKPSRTREPIAFCLVRGIYAHIYSLFSQMRIGVKRSDNVKCLNIFIQLTNTIRIEIIFTCLRLSPIAVWQLIALNCTVSIIFALLWKVPRSIFSIQSASSQDGTKSFVGGST